MTARSEAKNPSDLCCSHSGQKPAPAAGLPPERGVLLSIPSMDCAVEEGEIRHALQDFSQIRGLSFQLAERTLNIDAPAEVMPEIVAAIRSAGFSAKEIAAGDDAADGSTILIGEMRRYGLALVLAVLAELLAFVAPETLAWHAIGMITAASAIALAGFSTYRKGLAAVAKGRMNINALMAVAVTGAFVIGQWPEAAMVMALYAVAELIEAQAVDRARNAIKSLLDMAPTTADERQPDGTWQERGVDEILTGAEIRVRPGASVPLDGVITDGASTINQAPVTGESMPVERTVGDIVFAGTINQTGMLRVRVSATSADSTLARIIHAVEQAQAVRAPTQRLVDRFAAVYTPMVFVLSLLIAIVAPLAFDWTWIDAAYSALVILVIACPCALVIATPVSVVSGLAAAARRGILIKGGVYLEDARLIRVVALDKTGTVTEGMTRMVGSELAAGQSNETLVMRWAGSLAAQSDHPVAVAIARDLAVAGHSPSEDVTEFIALPGSGVQGRLGKRLLTLANRRWVEASKLCTDELRDRMNQFQEQGCSVSLLTSEESVLAIFAVADVVRQNAKLALDDLHELGVRAVMLTGDNLLTAQAIGQQAGIDDIRAELMPVEKLATIEALQTEFGMTAMVGDGINDAPALARADIGFAMGAAGTDTAMEAADIVIMNDDLTRIAEAIRLSKLTRSVLWQNIALAMGIKAVFLVLAITGHATMWMAVFADMGASLIVVTNGLRLLGADTRSPRNRKP